MVYTYIDMQILLGIIIGLLLAIFLLVSNRKFELQEKIEEKVKKIISPPPIQKAMIIEMEDSLEQLTEILKNE